MWREAFEKFENEYKRLGPPEQTKWWCDGDAYPQTFRAGAEWMIDECIKCVVPDGNPQRAIERMNELRAFLGEQP